MTAEQKADQLVGKFKSLKWNSGRFERSGEKGKYKSRSMTDKAAVQAAIIAVEEIRETHPISPGGPNSMGDFWQQVSFVLMKKLTSFK